MYICNHATACIARKIEDIILSGENSSFTSYKLACAVTARAISVTVFPIFLALELTLTRVPKLLLSKFFHTNPEKTSKNVSKIQKYCLAILGFPLGLFSPDILSNLFLKNPYPRNTIMPFGSRHRLTLTIHYPKTVEQLQELVKQGIAQKKQISTIGAGMSQGLQTIPSGKEYLEIHMKDLDKIEFLENNQKVKVQAGATWEQVQVAADQRGKSVIVKQASDIFSIGGSIAINCHGWAHKVGSISSTIEALEIINSNGELQILMPKDELFACMFGTLGYFGIIVSATIKLIDNEQLIKKTEEIIISEFVANYENAIKEREDIPLFGGRLTCDALKEYPLSRVCMVRYERNPKQPSIPLTTKGFTFEPKFGKLSEQIVLHAISCLPMFFVNYLISFLWFIEEVEMFKEEKCTRNQALHPPIKAFMRLNYSRLHAQWLQEYFITREHLTNFLLFLAAELKANQVRLINATIRPVPKDEISILPYAGKDVYGVVICFYQRMADKDIEDREKMLKRILDYIKNIDGTYFQPYSPFPNREDFVKCYGQTATKKLAILKQKYDPNHIFGNAHTAKYFDSNT